MSVDILLRDGHVEIGPAAVELAWERDGRVQYPILPAGAGMSDDEMRADIEATRP